MKSSNFKTVSSNTILTCSVACTRWHGVGIQSATPCGLVPGVNNRGQNGGHMTQ